MFCIICYHSLWPEVQMASFATEFTAEMLCTSEVYENGDCVDGGQKQKTRFEWALSAQNKFSDQEENDGGHNAREHRRYEPRSNDEPDFRPLYNLEPFGNNAHSYGWANDAVRTTDGHSQARGNKKPNAAAE